MNRCDLHLKLADQLYTWTDNYAHPAAQTDFCCSASAPTPAPAADAAARSPASWFSHRALQTLWQTRLQMRSRPRPRPQVLPLGQSLRTAAANGLHSPGFSPPDRRISGQLSATPSALGRDLRESRPSLHLGSIRCRTRQPAPRQHDLRLARPRSRCAGHQGGRA